jgi:hypothetical protein
MGLLSRKKSDKTSQVEHDVLDPFQERLICVPSVSSRLGCLSVIIAALLFDGIVIYLVLKGFGLL